MWLETVTFGKTITRLHVVGSYVGWLREWWAKLDSRLLCNAMGHPGWLAKNTHHNILGMHFELFFSSALCYCTAELLSSRRRPSSVRLSVRPSSVTPVFSEPVRHINAKFGGKVPFHHISRPFLFVCLLLFFQNFACFFFFLFWFFVFTIVSLSVNMGPYGRKILQTTFRLKVHSGFTPKYSCIPGYF